MTRKLATASILAAALAGLLVMACSKEPTTAPEATPEVNPDKPNGNARILSQTVFGDANRGSSIWQLEPEGGPAPYSQPYFRGVHNNQWTLGRLGTSGGLLWSTRLTYSPTDIHALSRSSPIGDVVAAGKLDTDGDGSSNVGYVSLFTFPGSLTSQILYSSDSSDVWLNAIEPLSDSLFVVAGGERTPQRANPFVATVALAASGQLEKRQQIVVHTIAGRACSYVATDPAAPAGEEVGLYLLTFIDKPGSSPRRAAVHKLSIALPTLAPWSVEWTREIVAAGPSTWGNDLCVFLGNLYLVGGADDPGKESPTAGGYWSSGLAASLTPGGDLRWQAVVPLTKHTELFRDIVHDGTRLYGVGDCAGFMLTKSKEVFGYGWIAGIAPSTGEVLSSMTFGGDGYESGFNSAIPSGATLRCGGWTREETSGGTNPAWFCVVDVSQLAAGSQRSSPAPARAGDRVAMDRGQRETER